MKEKRCFTMIHCDLHSKCALPSAPYQNGYFSPQNVGEFCRDFKPTKDSDRLLSFWGKGRIQWIMIELLIANWKYILIAALTATNILFYNLWQGSKEEFVIYQAEVRVLGEEAERKVKEVEANQQKVLEDVTNEWNKKLPKVREDAVAAYKRRYPNLGLRLPNAGSSQMPGTPCIPQGANGTSEEQVVVGTGFIQDSAEDALKIEMFQKWVRENNLKVR